MALIEERHCFVLFLVTGKCQFNLWISKLNVGGGSERAALARPSLPQLLTSLRKTFKVPAASVELLSGQQIKLRVYWAPTSRKYGVGCCKETIDANLKYPG